MPENTRDIFTPDFIHYLLEANSISHGTDDPLLIVYRNTGMGGEYLEDTGLNNCCRILLTDWKETLNLEGRSYPHDKYQRRMVTGRSLANYNASSYVRNAYIRGTHFGKEALVEHVPHMILRSRDMILGNDDDYAEFKRVADNFHGGAPMSAGCTTVAGLMDNKGGTGDWELAHEFFYHTHAGINIFHSAIFQHEDFDLMPRLRYGSRGETVKELQNFLNKYTDARLTVDGDFGPGTFFFSEFVSKSTGYAGGWCYSSGRIYKNRSGTVLTKTRPPAVRRASLYSYWSLFENRSG